MNITLSPPDAPPLTRHERGTGALQLAIGRAARESNGAPPRDTSAAEGMIHVRGNNVGKDWIEQLHEWWLRHSEYPQQAALRGEDGTVQIHLKVDRFGHVELVEVESRSGSQWLDLGAVATFRNRTDLPPLPLSTIGNEADLDITIDYILIGK
jgi:protein TonB